MTLCCCCCCSADLVPLDGAGDGDEDADGEGEVARTLQHLVHRPGVHHLHTNMGKNIAALTDGMVILSLSKALRYCGWDCKIIFIDYFLKGLTDSQTRGAVSLGIEACENHKLGVSRKLNIFILAVKNTPENHKVWF